MSYTHANRGRPLEQLLENVNQIYRQKGIAMIHKVPTAWIPIRDRRGKIVTAKVDKKASPDFLGVYLGRAVAFDAKYTDSKRIRWDRLKDHQRDFLDAWDAAGGISFVLVGFTLQQLYVVPWEWWRRGYEKRQAGKGMASFTVRDLRPEWLVTTGRIPLDYLAVLDKFKEADRIGGKKKRSQSA